MPKEPGVYQFLDESNEVLYVGKAKDLRNRVSSYFVNQSKLGDKTNKLVRLVKKIKTTIVESEIESLLLEAQFIKKFNPKFNSRLTDGKSYPYIQISMKNEYPSVLIARRTEDKYSKYFGPFPSGSSVKTVLKTVRRIFPFQSVAHHPKYICFYNHLGLCPCAPVFDSQELKKQYRRQIFQLIYFLQGNKKKVIEELEKERDVLSGNEEFEKAQELQKKIDAILYVTSRVHKPFDYETNPNLRSDLRKNELDSLKRHLEERGVLVNELHRIECFDISNIQGTNSVGSMVVFTDGEKDSQNYRRFTISPEIVGPNDFASMEEVLTRRLKHTEWPFPDLIIVDGGKGQVSSGLKALNKYKQNLYSSSDPPIGGESRSASVKLGINPSTSSGLKSSRQVRTINIPLIGLAKRNEIIITSDFKEIRLPKDSPALHLIQRIRDEAHRFAITYHKKLRAKMFLQN